MSNAAVFLNSPDVVVAAAGALSGDGSIGDPLQVEVDNVTVTINGDNQLEAAVAPGGADTQVQFNDSGAFGGDAGFTFDKTNNVVTLTSIAGAMGSNPQTLRVLGVNAATPVGVGDGVDPALIVALKTPTAENGGGAQMGALSTDYSTDPSDAFVVIQDAGGLVTLGVGYGGNGQHVVQITLDHRTDGNDAAIAFYPNGGSSPVVTISRAGVFTPSGGYHSSDGTAGFSAGPFTSITSITVKDGLVTDLQGS